MKNLFKKFQVTTATTVAFDVYEATAYTSKDITATIPVGSTIVGETVQKGDKTILVINPKEQNFAIVDSKDSAPVTTLLEIPMANVKKVYPWWLLLLLLVIIGGVVYAVKKFKK